MRYLLICFSLFGFLSTAQAETVNNNYLIGRAITDVTGPALGLPMWGFGKEGQNTQGIHIRLRARAFVIAQADTTKRIAFVSVDVGSIEHNMALEVVQRLQARFNNLYNLDNVILSATHTHAGPGGYWHSRSELGLAGAFYPEHYDRIVSGITQAIVQAHENLQPGHILINQGDVEDAGINRSLIAYQQNPAAERSRYPDNIDKQMTLLKFVSGKGDMGLLNWYAVHPTSMTFDNRLISGDHKGYASLAFETQRGTRYQSGQDFVAAFAQSNPGDVTPNLNLNNTGPGKDDVDSTAIIGQRQLAVAQQLFSSATEQLTGDIDYRQIYVDLSNYEVGDNYTHAGTQTTCPSAYGYSFAGGSTEDGGGHFLFEEGMTQQSWWLDFLIGFLTGAPDWTQQVKDCQAPKPILFETGTGTPPLQSQIRPVTVARIGQLVILAMPAEITTMAARRLRTTAMQQLGDWAKHIVIAGYANDYAGYITTPEEYQIQQYEAGHTLHGPWTLPAYQQVVAQLATALENNTPINSQLGYDDWRGKSPTTAVHDGSADTIAGGKQFGGAFSLEKTRFTTGEQVLAKFYSGNPSANHQAGSNYLTVEQQRGDTWQAMANDGDWNTQIRWLEEDKHLVAQLSWLIPESTPPGRYRIKHNGQYTNQAGTQTDFNGVSEVFAVQ